MARCLLTRMFLLLALAGAMIAGSAHGQTQAQRERMVQRVYSMADLVVPIDAVKAGMGTAPVKFRCVDKDGVERIGIDFEAPQSQAKPLVGCRADMCPPPHAISENQLISFFQNTMTPNSWVSAGGAATIDYVPGTMALVINQSEAVHEEITAALDSLRRLQDVQVAMDIQIVTISDRMFEHLSQEFDLNQQPSKLLDGDTVAKILDAFQGDRRTNILQAPKVTTFNGQEVRVVAGEERFFVTGMKAQRQNGQLVLMPQNERFHTGSSVTVQPTVTPDNRNVVVKFHAELSEMPDATVPLFPVTTFITPVFEGGAQGQPIPFTQFIQQPTVVTRGVTKVLAIPDGKTGFIYGGRCSHTVKHVTRVPVLGDLPLLGDLFKSESEGVESNHLIFLVTPNVVLTGDAADRAAASPPCEERKPYVGMMPTQAPMAVVEAANCCTAPVKKAETTCANPKCCAQCPDACPAEKCAAPCCTAPKATCPLCTKPCTTEKCPAVCCDVAPTTCPPCTKPCPTTCAVPPTMCPPCMQPCSAANASVMIKASIMTIDDSFFVRPESEAWSDLSPKSCNNQVTFVDAGVADRFCRTLRAQQAGKVLAEPIQCTESGRPVQFVASMGGIGMALEMSPTVSADGEFCELVWRTELTRPVDSESKSFQGKANSPGLKEAVQVVNTSTVHVQQCEIGVTMPIGRTLLYYVCKDNVNEGKTHYAVLLTPEVYPTTLSHGPTQILPTSVELAPAPTPVVEAPPANESLRKLMAKYQRACAEGRTKDAKKLAGKCLAIDPKCFARDE